MHEQFRALPEAQRSEALLNQIGALVHVSGFKWKDVLDGGKQALREGRLHEGNLSVYHAMMRELYTLKGELGTAISEHPKEAKFAFREKEIAGRTIHIAENVSDIDLALREDDIASFVEYTKDPLFSKAPINRLEIRKKNFSPKRAGAPAKREEKIILRVTFSSGYQTDLPDTTIGGSSPLKIKFEHTAKNSHNPPTPFRLYESGID